MINTEHSKYCHHKFPYEYRYKYYHYYGNALYDCKGAEEVA